MAEDRHSAEEKGEYDYEGDMAKSQLKSIITNAQRMHDMLEETTNLPEWVQSKITLAEDYILTATSYMEGEMSEEYSIQERINMAKAKMGDVIKDFYKSDAPQFAGRSKEKRRQMAVAAKLGAMRKSKMSEELKGNQHKIDANKNNKIDAHDFKLLRSKLKVKKEEASPMIKPPSNRFDNKKDAFAHAKKNGGKVYRHEYVNPRSGMKSTTFSVKEEVEHKVGDKIQTKVGGKWISATITKSPHPETGNYGVRFKVGSKTMNYVSSPNQIKKIAKEEVEQIDEAIPKSTSIALVHTDSKKIVAKGNKNQMMKKMKELNSKEKGSHHLGSTYRGKVGDTFGEEVEQVNELKKSTLGSYIKKASSSAVINTRTAAAARNTKPTVYSSSTGDFQHRPDPQPYEKKASKRLAGISKAVNKMAKEEVEIDEGAVKATNKFKKRLYQAAQSATKVTPQGNAAWTRAAAIRMTRDKMKNK